MGSFDQQHHDGSRERAGRSVLKSTIGNTAENDPEDLRRVEATLRVIGAISPHARPLLEQTAILEALQSVETHSDLPSGASIEQIGGIEPGGKSEIAFRRALARGRFPLSHRAVTETVSPRGPRMLIGKGMLRAREKLATGRAISSMEGDALKFRRAALPSVAAVTSQTNGRLAAMLAGDSDCSELIQAITLAITEGGRQGFADVRDLWIRLEGIDRDSAKRQARRIEAELDGLPLRRFRKLSLGQPPTEGDFNDCVTVATEDLS